MEILLSNNFRLFMYFFFYESKVLFGMTTNTSNCVFLEDSAITLLIILDAWYNTLQCVIEYDYYGVNGIFVLSH